MVCGLCHAIGLLLVLTDETVDPFGLQLRRILSDRIVHPEAYGRRAVKAQYLVASAEPGFSPGFLHFAGSMLYHVCKFAVLQGGFSCGAEQLAASA